MRIFMRDYTSILYSDYVVVSCVCVHDCVIISQCQLNPKIPYTELSVIIRHQKEVSKQISCSMHYLRSKLNLHFLTGESLL